MLKGIEFLLKKSRGKVGGGKELSFLAPVILGRDAQSVPKILWQQVTNLVNKFALLLQRSMLTEDSRDKPENDWCWGRWFSVFSTSSLNVILRWYSLLEVPRRRIHNVIAKAMSICVAYGNKVMDTPELPQPIKRHVAPKYDMRCAGRSMIEMLGVLAIIAVLTTGGIAGYSKAMEKFKVNKTISEYNTLMFGFFQHLDDIRKTNVDSEDYNSLFVALDMVPKSWSLNGQYFVDDMGNYIRIYPTYIEIMFNYLGKAGGFKKNSFCRNLFELAKGYQNELKAAYIWKAETAQDTIYYGNRYCGDNIPCIRNMTFNEIDKQCQICNKLDVNTCSLVLSF